MQFGQSKRRPTQEGSEMHCARFNRRDLGILLSGAMAAWPLQAAGQQPLPVIGFLHQGFREPP